jgi:hypothetical protein
MAEAQLSTDPYSCNFLLPLPIRTHGKRSTAHIVNLLGFHSTSVVFNRQISELSTHFPVPVLCNHQYAR